MQQSTCGVRDGNGSGNVNSNIKDSSNAANNSASSRKQHHIDAGLMATTALPSLSTAVAVQQWQWHQPTCDWNFLKSNNQIPEKATAQFYA